MQESVISILKSYAAEHIQPIIARLNDVGIISDEDKGGSFGSTMMERWTSECTEFLIANGYNGSKLVLHAHYYEMWGAVYVLFNDEQHTYESARKFMDRHVEVAKRAFKS